MIDLMVNYGFYCCSEHLLSNSVSYVLFLMERLLPLKVSDTYITETNVDHQYRSL